MKHKVWIIGWLLIIALLFTGCSGEESNEGKIPLPSSSSDYEDAIYTDVVREFKNAGFTNVKTEKIEDLIIGWLTKDGEIETVTVDGHTSFNAGKYYDPNVEIVITYHTFPSKEETSDNTTEVIETSPEVIETESATETEVVEEDDGWGNTTVLTVDNSSELKELLESDDLDEKDLKNFVEEHFWESIEIDAYVIDMRNTVTYNIFSGEYEEHEYVFDIFFRYGKFSSGITPLGPCFQMESITPMGQVKGGAIDIHSNVHFTARLAGYDEDTGNIVISLEDDIVLANDAVEAQKVEATAADEPATTAGGIILPKKGSKLDKDYDQEFSSKTSLSYLNVDNLKNKPKLVSWGKVTVTDGVLDYLDYLESQGCKIKITLQREDEPYSGFHVYETEFEVTNSSGVSWTMYLMVEDEDYVEYDFTIDLD